MAKARSRKGGPASARTPGGEGSQLSLRMAHPQPAPGGGAAAQPLPSGAANGVFVVDISEDLEITGKFVCKVPVANDVLYCNCGGVMSQRFNESLFCRTCGKEGSH